MIQVIHQKSNYDFKQYSLPMFLSRDICKGNTTKKDANEEQIDIQN